MKKKIADLTVDELRELISDTVKETMEDLIEDIQALSSESYIHSVEEARKDYREGRVKSLEDI